MHPTYDVGVCFFRGRPITPAHVATVRASLGVGQYAIALIGSVNEAPHFKNPHTFEEVSQMLRASLSAEESDRVFIFGIEDRESDLLWIRDAQRIVDNQVKRLSLGISPKIALVGYSKDGSSYYLKKFPDWGSVATQAIVNEDESLVSATDIRNKLYRAEDPAMEVEALYKKRTIPQGTYLFLRQWVHEAHFVLMRDEFKFMMDEYLPKFHPNPYTGDPQQFNCADMFVFHAGAVALVQRGQMPGIGLWASPGGHKRSYQTFLDAGLDEFGQETKAYDLNPGFDRDVLASHVRGMKLLDNPWRSNREVTVSVAYGVILPSTMPRLILKGADDAREARWWNTDEVKRSMMFEDLYNPFEYFLNSFRDLTI